MDAAVVLEDPSCTHTHADYMTGVLHALYTALVLDTKQYDVNC